MSSQTPNLAKSILDGVERRLETLHTCMPGVIVSYNPATGLANIKPQLQIQYVSESQPTPLPVIPNVPVVFPRSQGAYLRLPLSPGDTVMLHFSERSLDTWLTSGGDVMPSKLHKFNLKDAIATPGLTPLNKPLVFKGAADSLELGNSLAYIEITKDGKFKVKNFAADLFTVLDSLLQTLISATVIDPIGPTPLPFSPADITALTSLKVQLEALKG